MCGTHQSAYKMRWMLKRAGMYWSTMLKDCCEYYKGCESCQKYGKVQLAPASVLHPTVCLACLCFALILVARAQKLETFVDCMVRTEFTVSSVIIELSPLPLLKFSLMLSLISKLMVTCLDDRMVNTRNVRTGAENSQGNGNPPPPPSLAQAIASIHESHDEQTKLLRQLIANSTRGSNGARNAPAPAPTTYSDFAAMHPLLFTEVGEPLEADHWLRVMESKFRLLPCTEVQKTLFTTQQLRGDTGAWWANYTTTQTTDYQVPWVEFCDAFHAHYIPTGMMRKKR
jgi:hypothetical protein